MQEIILHVYLYHSWDPAFPPFKVSYTLFFRIKILVIKSPCLPISPKGPCIAPFVNFIHVCFLRQSFSLKNLSVHVYLYHPKSFTWTLKYPFAILGFTFYVLRFTFYVLRLTFKYCKLQNSILYVPRLKLGLVFGRTNRQKSMFHVLCFTLNYF